MLFCTLAFLAGISLVQLLPELPGAVWLAAPVILAFLGWRKPGILPLAFFALGCAWATLVEQNLLEQSVPPELVRKTVTVTGTVASLPVRRDTSVRFNFRIEQASYEGKPVRLPEFAQLSSYQYRGNPPWFPAAGSRWQLQVRLKSPHGFQNPGGFDYEAYLFSQRIRATGYVHAKSPPVYLGEGSVRYTLDRTREKIGQHIRRILASHPQQAIIAALGIGDRQGLDRSLWSLLQKTGTAHLVAISGLHLALVSGLVFFLFSRCWAACDFLGRRLPAQKAGAVAGIAVAMIYAGLAGFAIPTQRALVMLLVVYGALLFSRRPLQAATLSWALLAVLVLDPLSVLSASFWLSFSAVLVILFLSMVVAGDHKWLAGIKIQLGIALGLVPLTLLFFHNASLVAPLANLVAIPLYGLLVVPITLVALALPDPASTFLLELAADLSSVAWQWLQATGNLVPFPSRFASPGIIPTMLAMLGFAILVLSTGSAVRWLGLCFFLPLTWTPAAPAQATFRATLLDVGQGLALVVQTRNHALLYDTGARFSENFNAGEAVVLPYLRYAGIRHLDTLIISHGDNDHVGGLEPIQEQLEIQRLISTTDRVPTSEPCVEGKHWSWDGVEFRFLHPTAVANKRDNNNSCVLMIRGGNVRLLVTGDIEARAERQLVRRYDDALEADYLVAPHHGSRTSSTDGFLARVKPRWVLVPAGHLNRYKHPARVVIDRYHRRGIPWLVSGQTGAIEIDSADSSAVPRLYRRSYKRYWLTLQ